MGNILSKRNLITVALATVAIGFLVKAGRQDSSKGLGSVAKSLGFVA